MPLIVNHANPINRASPLNRGLVSRHLCLPNRMSGDTWRDLTANRPCVLADGVFFDGPPRLGSGWQNVSGYTNFPSFRPGGWGSLNYRQDTARSSAITSDTAFVPFGSRSLFLWIYPTKGDGSIQGLVITLENLDTSARSIIHSRLDPSSGQKYSVIDSSNTLKLSVSNIPDNQWSHVGFSWDAGTSLLRMYVNGRLDATHTSTTLATSATINYVRYGWRASTAAMFCGGMDDICIFNRFMDAEEYSAFYHDSRSGHPNTLNWLDQTYYGAVLGKRTTPFTAPSIFPVWLTV
jgi:hypothetical protein